MLGSLRLARLRRAARGPGWKREGAGGVTKDMLLGRRGPGMPRDCRALLPLPFKLSFVALELMVPALQEGKFSKTPSKIIQLHLGTPAMGSARRVHGAFEVGLQRNRDSPNMSSCPHKAGCQRERGSLTLSCKESAQKTEDWLSTGLTVLFRMRNCSGAAARQTLEHEVCPLPPVFKPKLISLGGNTMQVFFF